MWDVSWGKCFDVYRGLFLWMFTKHLIYMAKLILVVYTCQKLILISKIVMFLYIHEWHFE